MVANEPDARELAWRLGEVQRLLGELVGRAEYQARLEAAEHRFAELAADVAELRRKHDEDIATLREGRWHWQQVLIPCAVALVVALIGVLGELWVKGMH